MGARAGRAMMPFSIASLVLWALAVAFLGAARWSSAFEILPTGLTRRTTGRVESLAWEQVVEIHEWVDWEGATHVRVTAEGGQALEFSSHYRDADQLAGEVRRAAAVAIQAALQRELELTGVMTFRHPGSRWGGHVTYFVALCGFGGLGAGAWTLLATLGLAERSLLLAFATVILSLGVYQMLVRLRTRAAWRGGWVRLTDEALIVARLDGVTPVPWSRIAGVWRTADGHVQIDCAKRRPLKIPATIGNVSHFEELARAEVERRTFAERA